VGSSLQGTLYYWYGKQAFRCVLAGSLALALGGILLAAQAADNDPAKTVAFQPADPLNASAFEHFYNMDYDRSVQEFQKVLDRHPNDPFAVNHLLTAVMFRELYRMGALNTGDYANDSFIGVAHHPADPKKKDQIKTLVERAEKLEEEELKADPKNVDALYARGNTRAQFSTYTALIERAWFSALRNAVGARHDHERVLELNPQYIDAKLVVGAHNYVMGSLPWGAKVAVSMVGLSGSKEKGIEYLYEVARANTENSVDAKIALMLFLRREHRYSEALGLLRGMIQQYPQNVLPSTGKYGRPGGRGNIPDCTTNSRPCTWETFCGARKIMRGQPALTTWLRRCSNRIPKFCKNPTWVPVRCTTCSRSGIWPLASTRP
jgi:tetratricopeptide (TPR) repeat protein